MAIDVDGISICYKVTGTGDNYVIILQGWGTTCAVYNSVAAMLGQTMKVIQLDLPGFGASDEPDEPWDAQRYAEFVFRFCQVLGIERCMLLAHSFGGRVALKMVTGDEMPVEIDGLIMVDFGAELNNGSYSSGKRGSEIYRCQLPDIVRLHQEGTHPSIHDTTRTPHIRYGRPRQTKDTRATSQRHGNKR